MPSNPNSVKVALLLKACSSTNFGVIRTLRCSELQKQTQIFPKGFQYGSGTRTSASPTREIILPSSPCLFLLVYFSRLKSGTTVFVARLALGRLWLPLGCGKCHRSSVPGEGLLPLASLLPCFAPTNAPYTPHGVTYSLLFPSYMQKKKKWIYLDDVSFKEEAMATRSKLHTLMEFHRLEENTWGARRYLRVFLYTARKK